MVQSNLRPLAGGTAEPLDVDLFDFVVGLGGEEGTTRITEEVFDD